MKLISAHIRNFGKFSDYTIEFQDKITSVCEDNGYGKTTIAAFVKAMLFGMKTTVKGKKKNEEELSEREHFLPRGNGEYGGELVIEYNGEQKTIRRRFDKKTKVNDKLKVFNSRNEDLQWKDEDIEEMIGISESDFDKTLFMKTKDLEFKNPDAIVNKINEFLNAEGRTYQEIKKEIDIDMKELKKQRKRGPGKEGEIDKIQVEIVNAEAKIKEKKRLEEKRDQKEKESEKLKRERDEINEKIQKEHLKERYDFYNRLKKEKEEISREREELNRKYPEGLPSSDELELLKKCNCDDIRIATDLERWRLSAEEEKNLEALRRKYPGGILSEEDCGKLTEKLSDWKSASSEETEAFDSEEFESLCRLFEKGIPDIKECERKIIKYQLNQKDVATERVLSDHEKEIITMFSDNIPDETKLKAIKSGIDMHQNKRFSKNDLILILLSILVPVISIAIAASFRDFFAMILIIGFIAESGLIGILTARYLNSKKERKRQNEETERFFRAYLPSFSDIDSAYKELEKSISEYQELKKKLTEEEEQKEKKESENEELKKELDAFFKAYAIETDDYDKASDELRSIVDKYEKYLLKREDREQKKKKQKDRLDLLRRETKELLASSGIDFDEIGFSEIDRLLDDHKRFGNLDCYDREYVKAMTKRKANDDSIMKVLAKYKLGKEANFGKQLDALSEFSRRKVESEKKLKEKEEEIKAYKREKELDDEKADLFVSSPSDVSVKELEEKEKKKEEERFIIEEELKKIREDIEEANDWIIKIPEYTEKKKELETKYKNLELLMECFGEANENIHREYVGPIQNSFMKYADKINSFVSEGAEFDDKFNINYQDRDWRQFSDGEKACLAIVFRLAVIENIFKKEKPFIIMDDPLANLDAVNIENIFRVIREMAEHHQIVYFCCHQSRNMVMEDNHQVN